MENKVEIIEVWMPVKEGGSAINLEGKNLKMIAMFANGVPIVLEKEFYAQKRYITNEEYKQVKNLNAKLTCDL